MVDPARIELATSALQVRRAPSYATGPRERAARWPRTSYLLFTRQKHVHMCLSGIGAPPGFRSPYCCSTDSYDPISPPERGIVPRICPRNLRLRRAALFLVELGRRMAPRPGFEPGTSALTVQRSTS